MLTTDTGPIAIGERAILRESIKNRSLIDQNHRNIKDDDDDACSEKM
jgi:hypothetical protein